MNQLAPLSPSQAFDQLHGDLIATLSINARYPADDRNTRHIAGVLLDALTEQRDQLRTRCLRNLPHPK